MFVHSIHTGTVLDCTQTHPSGWGNRDSLDPSLTLATLQTAVVAHGAEELENEDGHSHHGQAHDEHHHPHGRTVGLFGGKQMKTLIKTGYMGPLVQCIRL